MYLKSACPQYFVNIARSDKNGFRWFLLSNAIYTVYIYIESIYIEKYIYRRSIKSIHLSKYSLWSSSITIWEAMKCIFYIVSKYCQCYV